MAKKGLQCPDCGTRVKEPPAGLAGVVQCPKCRTEIWYDPRVIAEETALQAQPAPEPPPLWALPGDEDLKSQPRSRPRRPALPPKKSGGKGVLIGLCVAGVLVLVLGGGAAAWWWGGPTHDTGDGTIPLDTLQHLKRASVFIKVRSGADYATGSGFVVQNQEGAVYVVTNRHVITPEPKPIRVGPRFGPPFGPGLPIVMGGGGPVNVTVVFHSGTPQEESIPAQIVSQDAEADLALLVCRGVKDVPTPVTVDQLPQLVETMPLVIFGFPFGEDLAVDHGNPAITVSKGSVSSLRNKGAELELVQIDGELNPGNSGGPVTDSRGNLVGVSVAKVRDAKKIGFAVPAQKVKKLLNGEKNNPPGHPIAQQPPQTPPAVPPNPRPQAQLPPPPPPQPKQLTKDELDKVLVDLKQKDHFTPLNAARRLVGVEPTEERRPEVVKALREALDTDNIFLKVDVAKAMGVWGPRECLPFLIKLVEEGHPYVSGQVLEVLAAHPEAGTTQAVAALLKHKDWIVRMKACDALGKIGTEACIPALEEAAKEGGLIAMSAEGALKAIRERINRKAEANDVPEF